MQGGESKNISVETLCVILRNKQKMLILYTEMMRKCWRVLNIQKS